jgi:hypothetical protein
MEKHSHEACSMQVEQEGYAIVPNVFKPEEAQSLALTLESSDLPRSRAGVRHLLSHPAVMNVASDPRLLGIAQSILEDNAFPFKATLFHKSPETNWLITWHQDTALPLSEKQETPAGDQGQLKKALPYAHAPATALEKVVALRLHLDDSTSENGPLRVVPGTHRKGVLSDKEVEAIVGGAAPIACVVPKGGLIVMRPLAIHVIKISSRKSKARNSHRICKP